MPYRTRFGQIALSGQTLTANAGGLLLNGGPITGAGGAGGGVSQATLDATGSSLMARDVVISGVLQAAINAVPAGGGGTSRPYAVTLASNSVIATNATLAPQFFAGSSAYATFADLTSYTGVRFVVNKVAVAGAANSALFLRYLGNFSVTPANYLPITSPEMRVQTNLQNVMAVSGFRPLVAGARSGVYLALIASGGDGALDPVFGNISATFL